MEVEKVDTTPDEDIFHNRLINDNEGNGEEKRINLFIKNFMLFLLSDKTNIEDTESAYRKLKNSLDQFEFNWDKILNCNCVLEDEYNYHQQSIENFKNSVIEAQKEIEHKRKDLMDARSVHRLRQEYTILSQNIKKFQDPLEIKETIETLSEQKQNLFDRLKKLDGLLDSYKNEFQVFYYSLMSLQERTKKDTSDINL